MAKSSAGFGWGNLAHLFHLIYTFPTPDGAIRKTLAEYHFDAIYLGRTQNGFSARFRELISSIPLEIQLEHFLNDGDPPDIPIPVYVDYLKRIRELARSKRN